MDDLKAKYLAQVAEAGDENTLEAIRVAAVGKKGEVALKMRELGKMTPEERQVMGPKLNALRAPPGDKRRSDVREARCVAPRTALGGSD